MKVKMTEAVSFLFLFFFLSFLSFFRAAPMAYGSS